VRLAALLACLLFVRCALPPRVDDRTNPADAYRTFRGALARQEYDREYACLSDGLRSKLGIESRAAWSDARLVLRGSHPLVKGIVRSHIDGRPRKGPDGRVRLALDLPFGYRASVWMRPAAVLRIWLEGDQSPYYEQLDGLDPVLGKQALGVRVPPDLVETLREELAPPGRRLLRIEAGWEWFLDDFDARDQTPDTVRGDLDEHDKEHPK